MGSGPPVSFFFFFFFFFFFAPRPLLACRLPGVDVRLVRGRGANYIRAVSLSERDPAVLSLLGVLGITVILFFVVAITARLILGR